MPSNRRPHDGALRGVKDNPPYWHDERLLTLDDTVEFFNLDAIHNHL